MGLFVIESAARHLPGGGEAFASKQKMWILVGSVVYFGAALIDYGWIKWLGIPMYLCGLALTALAMFRANETHQLDFGGFLFQPAPAMITAGIIALACVIQITPKIHRVFREPMFRVLIVAVMVGIPFLMVVKIGDMGSALVWGPVAAVTILVTGIPWRYLIFISAVVVGLVPILYFAVLPTASQRGTERIETFLEIVEEGKVVKSDATWGAYWASTAVGKAGWKGLGWNATEDQRSLHAKGYISKNTAHNDYVFAVFAEEQGFRGGLLLITGFALLMIQCLFVSIYSRDVAGRIIVGGVVALFFTHLFESVGMCVLLMPITGIPLPLISYSGTFVVICMFLLGMVQSVWIHRQRYIYDEDEEVKRRKKLV